MQRSPYLEQISRTRGSRDRAVRDSQAAVRGLNIVRLRVVEESTHFVWREVETEGLEALGLDQQGAVGSVIDLIVASGIMNERHLIGVLVVECNQRQAAFEPDVSVKAGRELDQIGCGIPIEFTDQQTIRHETEYGEKHRK